MAKILLRTRKQIADELSISTSTLKRWMDRENVRLPKGRYINPIEYKQIMKAFGVVTD